MSYSNFRPTMLRQWGWAAIALLAAAGAGCSATDSLLEVEDPDIINPSNLNSASAATALSAGVSLRLAQGTSGGESLFLFGGLLADEWRSGDTFEQRNTTDQRATVPENSFLAGQLRNLMRIRVEGELAVGALRQYKPDPISDVGRLFAFSAYAENLIGEHYCDGIPFSELDGSRIVYGEPVTTDSAFAMAIASADSALANSSGADSINVRAFASVIKARALLNRGNFAAAAAAVTGVATSFRYQVTHSANATSNQMWSLNNSAKRYVLSDREGINGLNFRTANDPRIPNSASGVAFDTFTPFAQQNIWARFSPVTIVSGIEARLIEAEAAAKAGSATYLTILNTLRSSGGVTGLAALTDPGTEAGRVDQVFRERAFWMFGTGHRLGDLRRLVRQYGRGAETVFPTGAFHKGGNYGNAVNIPVPFDEENNPNFNGCLNRDA